MELLVIKLRLYIRGMKRKCLSYTRLSNFLKENCAEIDTDKVIRKLMDEGIIYLNNGYYYCYGKDVKKGILRKTQAGNYFIEESFCSTESNKLTVFETHLNGAIPFDEVEYNINHAGDVVVTKILKRGMPNVVCQVREKEDGSLFIEPKRIRGKLNINLDPSVVKMIGKGNYALIKVDKDMVNGSFDGEFVKRISLNGTVSDEIALIAYANGFEIEFPEEVMEEARKIPQTVLPEEIEMYKDNDFRDEMIFSIDPVGAQDLDDAVSIKKLPNGNWEIGVHITNVSHYVKPGSHLFQHAAKNTTSLYVANTVIPLYPEILSNGIFSLNEGVDRLTKSNIYEVNQDGEIVSFRVCDSIINSKKKMNYDDVNRIILTGEVPVGYEPFVEDINEMWIVAQKMIEAAKKQGRVTIDSNELYNEYDEDGNIIESEKRQALPAQLIIEYFMVGANCKNAEYIDPKVVPFMYRVHEGPSVQKLKKAEAIIKSMNIGIDNIKELCTPKRIREFLISIQESDKFPLISRLIGSSFAKAGYSTVNNGHWGLASSKYGHTTSPDRRFSDTRNQNQMDLFNDVQAGKVTLSLADYEKLKDEVQKEAVHASMMEVKATVIEEEWERTKIVNYMKQFIGYSFIATIDDINSRYIAVTTEDGISGIATYDKVLGDNYQFHVGHFTAVGRKTKQKYKIGNYVKVTVVEVNELSGTIMFSIDQNLTKSIKDMRKGDVLKKERL